MLDHETGKDALMEATAASVERASRAPASFAQALFAHGAAEDLVGYTPESLALLVEQAWEHLAKRHPGSVSIRIAAGPSQGGQPSPITIVEILNDNMPFLVDSVMAELAEQGYDIRLVVHPIIAVTRDAGGALVSFEGTEIPEAGSQAIRESLIHIHLDRIDDHAAVEALRAGLDKTLAEVRVVVSDWKPMLKRLDAVVDEMKRTPPPIPVDELAEAIQFLEWLRGNNFTFLGLREYVAAGQGAETRLEPVDASGLGLLADTSVGLLRRGMQPVTMTPEISDFLTQQRPLIISKANRRSRVHRRVHIDYIGVKLFDGSGQLKGELRIAGLFTSAAYTRPPHQIPYLRRKIEAVTARMGFDPDSHSGKALLNVLESYPRDELFQIDEETLGDFAARILQLEERPRIRVLPRRDKFNRFVSLLVYVPRDRLNTSTRIRIHEYLAASYQGRLSAWNVAYPEGPLARLHFIVGLNEGAGLSPSEAELEAGVARIVRTWADGFSEALAAAFDPPRARALRQRYAGAFPAAYQERYEPETAVRDVRVMERLSEERRVAIDFYPIPGGAAHEIGLKLFHIDGPVPLSARVPVMEAMGFRAIAETAVAIEPAGEESRNVVLHDTTLARLDGLATNFAGIDAGLEAAFMAVWSRRAESDALNALVMTAGLAWREVALVRAISRYLRQARIPFEQGYLAATLVKHAPIAHELVALFHARFDPTRGDRTSREAASAEIVQRIEAALADVTSLDEDRILRRFLNTVLAMLRTNFYQVGADGQPKSTIAFKLDSKRVDGLPDPRPMVEIFVYSPRVEGVHLRFGRIARGGLRWSDRPQDFRTEVLGLVKAQQVKNAVIVPVGAKGGFVPKDLPPPTNRQAWLDEGIASYRLFVSSLLDITDNLDASGAVVQRDNVVRWDGDDPYLVVAADKGTATFSDLANGISAEYGHWLGDAFASGGSAGYDHKKMGITARGGWEAVKRHFREMDIDIQTMPFTVAGVGDMSGDVFGNGMLLSEEIRLVAAFDHRDIFIDPEPDAARSFAERRRMFELPRSSWQDYDKSLISPGGGVFSRSLKSIPLSAEMRALLRLEADSATPQEVMNAILKAPTDLLWFGGIGTYIRASSESDEDAGDRANDPIRVTAAELGARVIGEGANLGMTQRARIEAAQRGVRLNTDAIDNSAGVNSSDVEVNIKVALGAVMTAGALDIEARNTLLAAMTPEVAAVVLRNNYQQSLAISLSERRGAEDVGFARRLMHQLEAEGRLDRKVEFLPEDRELEARVQRGQGLTRPELAVLLAYAKLALHDELLDSSVPDDAYLGRELERYFPPVMVERYPEAIQGHRLRREIIATLLSNSIINRGGPTLAPRIADQTGASASEIAAAFAAVRDVFQLTALNTAIDALDAKISGKLQLALYAGVQEVLIDRIVWFLRHGALADGLERVVGRFGTAVAAIGENLPALLPEAAASELAERCLELARQGVPEDLARRLVRLPVLADVTDIQLVAEESGAGLADAARAFFAVGDLLRLAGIASRAKALQVSGYYDRLALDRAVSDLSASNRRIATAALRSGGLDQWRDKLAAGVERTRGALAEIAGGGELTVPKLAVAAGLLGDLAGG